MMYQTRTRSRQGQAIVEMAMLLPFFLLVVVGGMIDFGFAFYNVVTLQQIADDVAKELADATPPGGTLPSATQVEAMARAKNPSWWTDSNLTATTQAPVTIPGFPNDRGFRVVLTYDTPIYTPLWGGVFKRISGKSYLPLATQGTYRIPKHLNRH
ncbi:MAG: pilus assembly protein [Candidatus Riflebacteria bacterium]|nr:pilus assembly protein [Candidatus Riflebacteria bacterium]